MNNAIKKYGANDFEINVLECCELNDSDTRETYYILLHNTLFPNGYNLKLGGKQFSHTTESKKRVSQGVQKYFYEQKLQRFKDISTIDDDIDKYIKPLNRHNSQYC